MYMHSRARLNVLALTVVLSRSRTLTRLLFRAHCPDTLYHCYTRLPRCFHLYTRSTVSTLSIYLHVQCLSQSYLCLINFRDAFYKCLRSTILIRFMWRCLPLPALLARIGYCASNLKLNSDHRLNKESTDRCWISIDRAIQDLPNSGDGVKFLFLWRT